MEILTHLSLSYFARMDPPKTDTLLLAKHGTGLTSPKFLLKLNYKITLMGVFIIALVLGTFM